MQPAWISASKAPIPIPNVRARRERQRGSAWHRVMPGNPPITVSWWRPASASLGESVGLRVRPERLRALIAWGMASRADGAAKLWRSVVFQTAWKGER